MINSMWFRKIEVGILINQKNRLITMENLKLIPYVIQEGKERPIILVTKDKHRLRMNITITTSGTPDHDDTDTNMTIICFAAIHSNEDHTWTLGIEQLDMLAFYATDPAVSSPIAPEPTSNSGWDGALVMTVNDDRAAP
eukprot:456435_1